MALRVFQLPTETFFDIHFSNGVVNRGDMSLYRRPNHLDSTGNSLRAVPPRGETGVRVRWKLELKEFYFRSSFPGEIVETRKKKREAFQEGSGIKGYPAYSFMKFPLGREMNDVNLCLRCSTPTTDGQSEWRHGYTGCPVEGTGAQWRSAGQVQRYPSVDARTRK